MARWKLCMGLLAALGAGRLQATEVGGGETSAPPATAGVVQPAGHAVVLPTVATQRPADNSRVAAIVPAQRDLVVPVFHPDETETQPFVPISTGCLSEACGSCDCGMDCCDECCEDFWQHRCGVWGGFLYLHASGVDMAHAIQQNGTGGAGTAPDGRVGVAAPDYEPAFNVGVNWALTDCSSIWASYTNYESHTHDGLAAPAGVGGTVQSLVLHPGTVNAGSTASLVQANYDIDFSMVDINFSRLLGGSNWHAINYHVGVRYASLEQRFNQFGAFAAPTGDLNTSSVIDFEGVGPRIGLDGRARLGCGGFSLYGNSFLTFLLGEFDSRYEQFNETTTTRQAYSTWKDARMVPLLETELGLSWTSYSGCFRVSAGYQLMWWFDSVTVPTHIRAVQNANFVEVGETLAFDGLTTRVEWRF